MATAYAGGAPQAAHSPTTDLLTRHLGDGDALTHFTQNQSRQPRKRKAINYKEFPIWGLQHCDRGPN